MTTPTMDLPKIAEMYIKIRDAKAAAKTAFDAETKRMTDAMVKLENLALDCLNPAGAESIKTEFGTVFKKTRSSCTVKDRDEFYNFAVSSGNLAAIDMKANAKIVRELLDDGVDVPGVKYSVSTQVGIRRA